MRHPSRAARPFGLVASATAILAAIACGTPTLAANEETTTLAVNSLRMKPWVPTAEEPVTLSLEMPSTAKRGAMVPVKVHLHNGTDRPIGIGFGMNQGFDVIVAQSGTRPDSGAVWSPMKMPSTARDATVTDPLQPGRDTTFVATWPGTDDFGHTVPAGKYHIRAMVSAGLLRTRQIWTRWQPIQITP